MHIRSVRSHSYGPTYVCTPGHIHIRILCEYLDKSIGSSFYLSMPPSIRPSLHPRARTDGWMEGWMDANKIYRQFNKVCTQVNATLLEWDCYRVKSKLLSILPMYLSNA